MTRYRYAEGTTVPAARSRAEIERLLLGHGATDFGYIKTQAGEQVMCTLGGMTLLWRVTPPDDRAFGTTPTGRRRKADAAAKAVEDEYKRRWRAVLLLIKAKLEVIESGVLRAEEVFLPERVLPSGQTVAEAALPQIEGAGTVRIAGFLPAAKV